MVDGIHTSPTLRIDQHPETFVAQDVHVVHALLDSWRRSRYHPNSKQQSRLRIHRKYRSSNARKWLEH
jgi:hypothetical protein